MQTLNAYEQRVAELERGQAEPDQALALLRELCDSLWASTQERLEAQRLIVRLATKLERDLNP